MVRTKITHLLGVARTAVVQEMPFPARRFLKVKDGRKVADGPKTGGAH